jgi:hypothetical protein
MELHTWFQANLTDPLMCLLLLLENIRFQKLHIAATNLKAEKGLVKQMHLLHLTYHFSEDIFHLTLDDPTCKSNQTLQTLFISSQIYQHKNSIFCCPKWQDSPIQLSLVLWVQTIKRLRDLWNTLSAFVSFHGTRMDWYTHCCFKQKSCQQVVSGQIG